MEWMVEPVAKVRARAQTNPAQAHGTTKLKARSLQHPRLPSSCSGAGKISGFVLEEAPDLQPPHIFIGYILSLTHEFRLFRGEFYVL